jgi:hypothetical protein
MKLRICYDNLVNAFLLTKTVNADIRKLEGNNKIACFVQTVLTICIP